MFYSTVPKKIFLTCKAKTKFQDFKKCASNINCKNCKTRGSDKIHDLKLYMYFIFTGF